MLVLALELGFSVSGIVDVVVLELRSGSVCGVERVHTNG